jgi:hypothetical protein
LSYLKVASAQVVLISRIGVHVTQSARLERPEPDALIGIANRAGNRINVCPCLDLVRDLNGPLRNLGSPFL